MKKLLILPLLLGASPAYAASGPFFSLANSNFVVLVAFLLFLGVIAYLKVPALLAGLLDKRAEGIRDELDEARALREEAQTLLATYERKQREVQDQADRIVAQAEAEAQAAAVQAREDIKVSIARRIAGAKDQIASAEASAVREVRDTAIAVATAAAREVMASQMTDAQRDAMIDDAIQQVGAKLH